MRYSSNKKDMTLKIPCDQNIYRAIHKNNDLNLQGMNDAEFPTLTSHDFL